MRKKHPAHSALTSIFGSVEDKALRRLGTLQMRQILHAGPVIHRVSDTDRRVGDTFTDFSVSQKFSYI